MITPGLSRISKLLATTRLPWRAIHVAGTNGKGSICAYISAMLDEYNKHEPARSPQPAKIKHGRFTSPHLVDRHDGVTIDGHTISRDAFHVAERAAMDRDDELNIEASEFELLTATAFTAFANARLDVGVIEVGLGGRLDATNIIGQVAGAGDNELIHAFADDTFRPPPLVTAISSISLDHQGLLGNTIQEIAREKAGIIKKGVPVFYDRGSEVQGIIHEIARTVGAGPVRSISEADTARHVLRAEITAETEAARDARLDMPIQAPGSNGALALHSVWTALHRLGRLDTLRQSDRLELLAALACVPGRTTWPGRLQTFSLAAITGDKTPAIIDGAHNAQSARMLRSFLDRYAPGRNVEWVVGFSRGKDVGQMLDILVRPSDQMTAIGFGPVDGMPWVRPESTSAIAQTCVDLRGKQACVAEGHDLGQTLIEASESARAADRLLVVAGSLYLVGDVFRLVRTGKRAAATGSA